MTPSSHLSLCPPLPLRPSIFPSLRVFSSGSALHTRLLKFWSFSFSNSPSNEYSGLICFGMDWFDLLAGQGTLKNLYQHHSLKAPILRCSAPFWAECQQWPPLSTLFSCYTLAFVLFPIAAVTSRCKCSSLNQRRAILSMSGGQKSKIKASAGLVPQGG